MKYIKMLGLLAVAAAALMAFAGTASATTLTSSAGATPTIKAVNEGQLELHGPVGTIICTGSNVEGKVESHGAGVPASGKISTLTFTGCNSHVTVVKPGSLSITKASATGDGTLTSTGAEVTVVQTTIFGAVHCIYATNQTHIGTVTVHQANQHSTLDITGKIPRVQTNPLCGSEPAEWTGKYTVTQPLNLTVH